MIVITIPLNLCFFRINSIYNMKSNSISLLLLLLCLTYSQVIPFDKNIMTEIFQGNKPYLIYVHGNIHNFHIQSTFNGHCFGDDRLCAILNPTVEGYSDILQYVGNNEDEYFLIFDAANKRKYVLSANEEITQNDLLSFQYKYLNKQLSPYFASEKVPETNDKKCIKAVGKNLGEFLRGPERVKAVLLYSNNNYCSSCPKALQQFKEYAYKNYEEGMLGFAYFNTFMNDHPIIQDQKNPFVLIFIEQNYQQPFEISAENISNLDQFLGKTLRRNKKTTQAVNQQL